MVPVDGAGGMVSIFDRYFLRRQLGVFGFFALVLVMIYWINRAVALFDQLIADGQSALVFLELSILSLPGIVATILPFAAFAATLYATNRLMADSELVVAQATGNSPLRLARGPLCFGLIAAAMVAVLANLLVPMATTGLNSRQAEIARSATARLLHEGQFLNPAEGITLYIREITPEGELRDLFLQDDRNPDARVTYTARTAYLVRSGGSDGAGGAQLVMIGGMMQRLELPEGRLVTTGFDDMARDISALLPSATTRGRSFRELSTAELLRPTAALTDETGRSPGQLRIAGHGRVADPALTLAAALMGYAALMLGGFSRFGHWWQIGLAVGLVLGVKALDAAAGAMAQAHAQAWPVIYLPVTITLPLSFLFLWWAGSAHPLLRRQRRAA